MKPLSNPVVLRLMLDLLLLIAVFIIGTLVVLVYLRRRRSGEAAPQERQRVDSADFQLAAYHGVIQRLKEQEQELQRLRQRANEQAAASQNISDAVLSNLSSGVLLFNNAGMVTHGNAAARGILGYASPTGLHARDLFRGVSALRRETGEPSPEALPDALQMTLRSGQAFRRLEADYVTPAGEQRVLGITLSPVRSAGGDALGTACLVSDLTEVTELSRQMRLKDNLAALGEMSAGIAHEFKNSLATISGYAQMLTAENDPATVQQFAARIQAETASLTRIVTDFLAFARPQEMQRQPVDLRNVLEDCGRECAVELKLERFPSALPVVGDPTALRQVFANLLRNSAEAARDGQPVAVEAWAEAGEEATRVVLHDNGCGIPAEHLDRIFVPFFTTKAGGSGVGLALVHRIVSEHGGTVAVASDPAGTTFTLSFPAADAHKSRAQAG